MLNLEISIFGHLFLSIFENSKKLSPRKNTFFSIGKKDWQPIGDQIIQKSVIN